MIAKHEPGTDPASCFASLANYDPNDPKGEKSSAKSATGPVKKKKAAGGPALDDLLNAGLKKK